MLFSELFRRASVSPSALVGDAEVGVLEMDSRKVTPGKVFVCMPSANSDSNSYIPKAVESGATAVITFSEEGLKAATELGAAAALIPADQYNDSLWKLCKIAFGNPSASMKIIGVTGTNGKTTTCWLIRDMLQALGMKAGYIGTLGFQIPGVERELANTTPFAIELNELLAEARDAGVEAIAMEVSSHALAEKRADGVEFDVAVFTNLTQDHLDFHGSMEEYEAAKLRLFTELPKQSNSAFTAAINIAYPAGEKIAQLLENEYDFDCGHLLNAIQEGGPAEPRSLLTFSPLQSEATIQPLHVAVAINNIEFELDCWINRALTYNFETAPGYSERSGDHANYVHCNAALGGSYNLENLIAAFSAVLCLDFSFWAVRDALCKVRPVPGRFEPVPNDAGIGIIIDYAHTPDALEKVIETARPLTKGKLITVFGCGGDRDRSKRPLMAKAASERSDLTVVTSDNPRTEDPQAILDEVLAGIVEGREAVAILDRPEAVEYAVQQAQPGDTVIIAGKGHENYQIIGRTKFPMDDRELARDGLKRRRST